MLTRKEQQLLDVMEPVAEAHGFEIVTVEVIGAKKSPVIRVYIDTKDGVTFQELTAAQEHIGALLDEIDPFPGAYTLEVSSPGIDRPLRTLEHFERFAGEEARIRTSEPVNGSRNLKGTILGVKGTDVAIETENGRLSVPFDLITRANVVGKVEF